MAEKPKFIELRLENGVNKIRINVNEIATYYDRDYVYGEVRLKDGTIYKVWENSNKINDAIKKTYL